MGIAAERGIYRELSEYFSFYVPGYKFMPAYRNKQWDGKIRMFNQLTGELNVGLHDHLCKFCEDRDYSLSYLPSKYGLPGDESDIGYDDVVNFCKKLNLPFEPYDYQLRAVHIALVSRRKILLSPTGSGKSLIIYLLLMWYLAHHEDKVLVIVPTTSLVAQMVADFADYGLPEGMCHKIYSGKDKTTDKRIVVSTWQSIYKLKPAWFGQFGMINGDECHGFKSKSLSSIMNKSYNAGHRFGTTGTLDGTLTHKLVLEGLFGPVERVTTTKELQDDGRLAPLNINVIQMVYPEAIKSDFGKQPYQNEVKFVKNYAPRNKFAANLSSNLEGNTLVLFRFVDHGKDLLDRITAAVGTSKRKIYFVHGDTKTDDREAIRNIVEKQSNAIIVASLGTFSTGINIKNIHNIVAAFPSKSQIKVLQSIGRGLRLSDNGRTTQLYDLVDDITWKRYNNFCIKHGAERIKMYESEQFKYTIHKVDL